MIKKLSRIFVVMSLSIVFTLSATALNQTGSIKGKVADSEGLPLPGAFVFIDSPALLDIKAYITSDTGKFKFHSIPPSKYKVTVEMPGFKTVHIRDISVSAGMTVRISISLEMTTVEEETTLKMPGPTLDPESARSSATIEADLLRRIPFRRELHAVLSSAPGVIVDASTPTEVAVIHGASARANTYAFDSMNMTDPVDMSLLTNINFDIIEEATAETSGHPTHIGQTEGGYIQVVTKAGGNRTSGDFFVYHTREGLTSVLSSKEETPARDATNPSLDRSLVDFSLSFGGAILPDKLWFFTNGRLLSQTRSTSFIPWTDPHGKSHTEYDLENKEKMGFFKLTSQFLPNLKFMGMFNITDRYQSAFGGIPGWNITKDASRIMDHEKNIMATGFMNYAIDQNTFADFKAGYIFHKQPLLIDESLSDNPRYYDESTGRQWGSAPFNETLVRKRFLIGAYITRFQDSFLGADHTLTAGFEYENSVGESSVWNYENLSVHYLNENPYYYGLGESPETDSFVGRGEIAFSLASKEEGRLKPKYEMTRISLMVEDTITFADRVTLKLGLRLDRSNASQLVLSKGESGNPISLTLGEKYMEPQIGTNPYGELIFPNWKNMILWNILTPRASLIFDMFGSGNTLLKVSYARYTENLMLQYASDLNPYSAYRSHLFTWYDENMDSIVDPEDTFLPYPEDYRLYALDYYTQRIAPDISPPYTNEITMGFQQEVIPDLSLSLNYIAKDKKNILAHVLYSPDDDMDWYTYNWDTSDWWVPFSTVIPAVDEYTDTPVTLYFLSKDAPLLFYRLKNVPELKRKYRALEITIRKRMSHNWQMSGSLVLSRATGNTGLGYGSQSGLSLAARGANYFINLHEDSRLDLDRPLIVKLMGTYRFPYDFFLSFYYTHYRGTPWARNVSVVPPSSWTETANAYDFSACVLLEIPGERRYYSQNNLDIRVEKEFSISRIGKIRLLLDVINVLGNTYEHVVQNDGGYWYPAQENSTEGTRILDPYFNRITSVLGTRIFRIGLNFQF